MRQAADHYLIFGTVGGFCGIAWNDVGITRFQLPTRTAEAAERSLLRRAPGARRRTPTPEVAKAIAGVKRYFEGEETDFAGFTIDLGEQDPFFERIYEAARRIGWGHTTTYGTLAKQLGAGPEAARDVGKAHGQESGGPDHPLPQGPGGRRQGRGVFRAGWLGSPKAHARAGGSSPRSAATGPAIFPVLKQASVQAKRWSAVRPRRA